MMRKIVPLALVVATSACGTWAPEKIRPEIEIIDVPSAVSVNGEFSAAAKFTAGHGLSFAHYQFDGETTSVDLRIPGQLEPWENRQVTRVFDLQAPSSPGYQKLCFTLNDIRYNFAHDKCVDIEVR